MRQILGHANFTRALEQIQRQYGGASISEPQLEAAFGRWLPSRSTACRQRLGQFFTEWFDTAYPRGGAAGRPQITGPGLAGRLLRRRLHPVATPVPQSPQQAAALPAALTHAAPSRSEHLPAALTHAAPSRSEHLRGDLLTAHLPGVKLRDELSLISSLLTTACAGSALPRSGIPVLAPPPAGWASPPSQQPPACRSAPFPKNGFFHRQGLAMSSTNALRWLAFRRISILGVVTALIAALALVAVPASRAGGVDAAVPGPTRHRVLDRERHDQPGRRGRRRRPGTRWSSAFSDAQWLSVDLGRDGRHQLGHAQWEAAYGKAFQLQTSNDNSTWTTIYSTTTGTGGTQTLNVSGTGRYVRMNGTARGTQYGYSLFEFQVYGTTVPQTCGTANAALNQPATASSYRGRRPTRHRAPSTASQVTRWSSAAADGQWLQVDLGQRPADLPGVAELGGGLRNGVPDPDLTRRQHLDHALLDDHRRRRHRRPCPSPGPAATSGCTAPPAPPATASRCTTSTSTPGQRRGRREHRHGHQPGSQASTVGTAVSKQISATDSASGQTLTYSATGLPAGLSISSSGLITGDPTTAGSSTRHRHRQGHAPARPGAPRSPGP